MALFQRLVRRGDVPRLGYIPRNGVELPFQGGYVFVPIDNVACAGERFVWRASGIRRGPGMPGPYSGIGGAVLHGAIPPG